VSAARSTWPHHTGHRAQRVEAAGSVRTLHDPRRERGAAPHLPLGAGTQRAAHEPMRAPTLVIGCLSLALTTAGCGVIQFGMGYDIGEQLVEGSPTGGALGDLGAIPIDINLTTETSARGTGPAQHIYLTSFTLSVTATAEPAGDADDLGFIDHIEVFAEGSQANSTLPRVRIAHLDQVPDGQRTISLESDGVDLLPYLREGARLEAMASGTQPPDDVTYAGHLDFTVVVL
jgi:hypothetical protein